MTPPWGINWQRYHADRQDMPHIEKMQYKSFTTYKGMWDNRDFVNELLSVARKDAIFLDRDHAKSEEKDDQWKNDPALKGRNHADDWAQKVKAGQVFTPLDRTFFLGINEPDSNQFQRVIDAYNEAYCRRMAEHGLRAAAYSFGVGHPSTVGLQPKTPPDWSWYAASAAAILEGHHIAATHEYGAPDGYGWEYWCNRISFCPYPFDVVYDECGIDYGVVDSGNLKGWSEFMDGPAYCRWLDGFQAGMAERAHTRKVNVLAYNIFGFDHGSSDEKDWHSFDIRPIRPLLEAYQWTVVAPPSAPTPPQPPTKPTRAYVIAPAGARLRAQPNTDADTLAIAPYSDEVSIIGVESTPGWVRVRYGNKEGYMASRWISLHAPEPLPAPTEPPPQPEQPSGDTWARSLAFVRRWEGGWADDPNDPGGATNKGITIGAYTRWREAHGQPVPTKDDLRNISDAEVEQIYREWYWLPSSADTLPFPMCLAVFDLAVNGGIGRAQEAFAAVGHSNFLAYMAWRLDWYTRISGWKHFGAGWTRRVADLLKEASI